MAGATCPRPQWLSKVMGNRMALKPSIFMRKMMSVMSWVTLVVPSLRLAGAVNLRRGTPYGPCFSIACLDCATD